MTKLIVLNYFKSKMQFATSNRAISTGNSQHYILKYFILFSSKILFIFAIRLHEIATFIVRLIGFQGQFDVANLKTTKNQKWEKYLNE